MKHMARSRSGTHNSTRGFVRKYKMKESFMSLIHQCSLLKVREKGEMRIGVENDKKKLKFI